MNTTQIADDTPVEKLTIDQWLERTNELGYFITQPYIRYETKGWKSVVEFFAVLLCLGLFLGCTMGGAMIGAKYYDNKVKCEKQL